MYKSFNLFRKGFCSTNTISDPIFSQMLGVSKNILGLYLNTPKNRNALSRSLLDSLKRNIEKVNLDHEIRAVVLMSKEPGYFCAGADLKERATMNDNEVELFVYNLRQTFQDFSEMRVPSISAIDGFALGGGLELALASDIRIATKTSTLGLSEVSLGIIPGAGGTQRLPRIVGFAKAKEMILTAERVDGNNALNIGLISHVVDSYKDLESKAVEIAEKIVKNAPLAITNAKKAIDRGIGQDIKIGLDIERLCYGNILKTEDRIEGMKAFIEKRKPQYKGK